MMDYTKRNKSVAATSGAETAVEYDQGLRAYMIGVYNYMAAALALSGVVAYAVFSSEALMNLFFATPLKWVVLFAPLVFVFVFSARVYQMSLSSAQACFWAFAAVMGLSLAPILAVYTGASVAKVFFISASVFGAMSLWGYTTKRDLTGFGSFLFMGLIGIILASLVNIFLGSPAVDFAVSILGVLIFVGLTAYDTQRIREVYYQVQGSEMAGKTAIMGALSLYLDFINLFIMLLRLFGDRR